MAYLDQAALARNEDFINRVRVAACKAAIDIASEGYGGEGQPTAAQHNLRIDFARTVLRDPEPWAIKLTWGCVANPVISADSIDSDLDFQVASMWNAYAGVVPAAT